VSETLAKLELHTEGPRGPDVTCDIVVPAAWLARGCRIVVDLPERLGCAACGGGGCDACGKSGALLVPKRDAPLELTLPSMAEPTGAVHVRLPGWGAAAADPEQPRGQLILVVRAGSQPSRGVRALSNAEGRVADARLVGRILLMVVLVSLLFVFLLWFSGWM
jgi:hypothetical protein